MKIRTFIKFVGIAAIGGVAYVHKQRSGEWTIAGIKDTLRYLQRSMGDIFAPLKDASRETLERAASVTESATRSGVSDDMSPRSFEYGQRRNDPNRY